MPKRCPNGTRRNKTTRKCEPKNKSMSKKSPSPSPKPKNKTSKAKNPCVKGIKMPQHRIDDIIEHERKKNESEERYAKMENDLNNSCFPKKTDWNKIRTYTLASYAAIKE